MQKNIHKNWYRIQVLVAPTNLEMVLESLLISLEATNFTLSNLFYSLFFLLSFIDIYSSYFRSASTFKQSNSYEGNYITYSNKFFIDLSRFQIWPFIIIFFFGSY